MAGKVVKDLSEDFLNCCICMSQFKTPKMLPCIHSFCEECIAKYAAKQDANEIPCPTCRKVCKLPETGVKGLQTNFHLINLAEKVNLLEKLTSKEKRPSVCDSCQNPETVAFCVDCNIVICSKCKGHHALFPLLQSHSVIPLNQLNDPKFQQEWKNARSPFCALHASEKLRFYCKTCSKLICRDCTIVLHSKPEHECTEAATQFNESKEELNILVENSMEQLEKAMGYIKEGNVGFALLNASKREIDIEITNHCDEILKEVKKVCDKQRHDLLDEISTGINPVEFHLQLATDWVKRMHTTQKMTRQIIKENNPWELMAMSFDLTSAFEALKVDNTTFQWSKFELQHKIAFAPGELPDINIGCRYRKEDVVVSDKGNIFYLCTFDEHNRYLNITKITGIDGKRTMSTPYRWSCNIPDGARLVAVVGRNLQGLEVLIVALGYSVAEFDCASITIIREPKKCISFVSKFMNINANNNEVYITSTVNGTTATSSTFSWKDDPLQNNQIHTSGWDRTAATSRSIYGYGSEYNQIHTHGLQRTAARSSTLSLKDRNHTFTMHLQIESMYVCSQDIFFYTGKGELKAYNISELQRLPSDQTCVCYELEPPNTLLNITETDILQCHRLGNYTHPRSPNINHDNVNVFIVWKGNMLKAGKKTDEKGWILKEYNTQDNKMVGILKFVNGKAPKPPSALLNKQIGNGGMQIQLCDGFGHITTYKRELYNQDVVPYEME